MTMSREIFEKAKLFLGRELSTEEQNTLMILCSLASENLAARLKKGVSPESMKEQFTAAAGVLALAMYASLQDGDVDSVKVGSVTVKRSSTTSLSDSLRALSEEMLSAHLTGRGFDFRGVRA